MVGISNLLSGGLAKARTAAPTLPPLRGLTSAPAGDPITESGDDLGSTALRFLGDGLPPLSRMTPAWHTPPDGARSWHSVVAASSVCSLARERVESRLFRLLPAGEEDADPLMSSRRETSFECVFAHDRNEYRFYVRAWTAKEAEENLVASLRENGVRESGVLHIRNKRGVDLLTAPYAPLAA
jgi:hypothetical protein